MDYILRLPWHGHLTTLTTLIVFTVGLIKWSKSSQPLKLLTIFLSISILSSTISAVFALKSGRNIFILHIYMGVSYAVLAFLFSYWQKGQLRQLIRLSGPLFIVFYLILLALGYEKLDVPPARSLSVMSILASMISLYTLLTILKRPSIYPVQRDERLWISIGTLIVFSSNSFVYSSILTGITTNIWPIHNILESIGNICYMGGLLWTRSPAFSLS